MGKYCLLEEVGRGGGGRVFLAVDVRLQKKWAVKIFDRAGEGTCETQILKDLDHPMIPRIVEYLKEEGAEGIVMDYLDGADLGTLGRNGRTFTAEQVLNFGIALCDVLQYLHSRKPPVIYGDLKPQNLMLTFEGSLKLIDFGCAKREGDASRGEFTGTKGYAAPEQYRGETGILSDIYGLGVTMEVIAAGKLPRELKRILKKCRRKNPAKRYRTAEQVRGKLIWCRKKMKEKKKRPRLAAGTAAVLTGLMVLNTFVSMGRSASYLEAVKEKRFYDAALLYPEREKTYVMMLEEGVKTGKTGDALRRIEGLQAMYPVQTKEHYEIRFRIGRLYLQGNPLDENFTPDYGQAALWYGRIPEEKYPDVKWDKKLLRILTQWGGETKWDQAAKALEEIYQRSEKTESMFSRETLLELLASVWMTNRYYFENAGEEPLLKCIQLSKEGLALAEEREGPGSERMLSFQMLLAQASYLTGMLEGDRESLKYCLNLYEELEKQELPENTLCEILHRMACICEELEKENTAARYYEKLLKADPDDVEVYCEYAMLELTQRGGTKKAEELLEKAAQLPGADKSRNYNLLKERMEAMQT